MQFKFVNVIIQLPETTTAEDVKKYEQSIKDFVLALGLTGTVGFNSMDDIKPTN